MDSELLELSRLVAQGDYMAAKRAAALIKKRAEDPKVKETAEADRRLQLLQLRCRRAREDAFAEVSRTLRRIADDLDEVAKTPVLLEEWLAGHEPWFWDRRLSDEEKRRALAWFEDPRCSPEAHREHETKALRDAEGAVERAEEALREMKARKPGWSIEAPDSGGSKQ